MSLKLDHPDAKRQTQNDAESLRMEEDALLQSLQASREEQDVYEDKVIREATHKLAPTLSGLAFPALDSLVHSSTRSSAQHRGADLPPIHKVLTKVRKSQQSTSLKANEADILYMKEQMLLQYMQSVAHVPVEDLPLRRNEEKWLENRQQREQEMAINQGEAESLDTNPPERKKVSFGGGGTNNPASTHLATRQARVSIMKRKAALKEHNQSIPKSKDDQEETVERKEELKRRRLERQKRKQLRRRAWKKQQNTESSSDEEREFGEHLRKKASKEDENDQDDESSNRMETDGDVDNQEQATAEDSNTVNCPLCDEELSCPRESDKDEFLSKHMDVCQRDSQSRRRTRRRTTRNSTRIGDNIDHAIEIDSDDQVSTNRRTTTTKKRKRTEAPAATPEKSPALDDLEEWVYEDRVDDWIENGLDRMREMSEIDKTDLPGMEDYGSGLVVPEWINNRLFGYQREGLRVMWECYKQESGLILGDEMGLGKTVQISSYLGSLAACRKIQSILLVVPATMLNHWLTELSIWAPGIRRVLIHPSGEVDGISRTMNSKLLRALDKWVRKSRKNRVYECIDEEDRIRYPAHSFCGTGYAVITTYENLRRNMDPYVMHSWSYVVLDEAQKIRNPDADITLACKRIRTPHRIAMSGTPIMNDLKELWSIFDFVFPGRLGTLPAFEQEFADPIRKGGYANASPMQVQLAYRCALTLRDLIEPYLLRRLKKDVKEVSRMPAKTEQVLFCRLTDQQRTLYESFLQSDLVKKVVRGSANFLGAITMLRKICNHPDLVCDPGEASMDRFIRNGFVDSVADLSDEGEEVDDIYAEESLEQRSGKLEVLGKILPLWKKQGHRVLIFCQWRKMLNIVQRFMMMKGWKFGRLDGNTNVAARQRLVDDFNTDESYFAMLCTTRTGGVGLNLTGASRVCLYSPDWNPQIDAQARERAWRFGQKKDVTIYRLITAGTVEEKIYQRQIFKTALANKVLQDPRQKRLFSQNDLRDLFTLKGDDGSLRSGAEGVTDTGRVTRGEGVVDVDENPEGNEDTLKDVMKSKGLAGVFDHGFVEGSSSKKSQSAQEMEDQAKKVARDAVMALRKSVSAEQRFTPTWTGTQESMETRRFGSTNQPLFQPHNSSGSQGLLNSLKQRAASIKQAGNGDIEAGPDLSGYTDLLSRIKKYVRQYRPTTEAVLKEFSDIPSKDVAIFRQLLKSVAKLQNQRWRLQQS